MFRVLFVCAVRRGHRVAALLLAAFPGCAGPEVAPLDPQALLAELRAVRLEAPESEAGEAPAEAPPEAFRLADGVSVSEAVAVGLLWNPELRALRSRVGIARAEVVVAGLLPDPQFGADLSDLGVITTEKDADGKIQSVDTSTSPLDWVAGLDLVFPLPRPGELAARTGVAEAQVRRNRADVARAEWRLVGQVREAFLGVSAADERLRLVERLIGVVEGTHAFFRRGRELGAATALEENLAALELDQIQQRREGLLLERDLARQRLNGVLGLPPDTAFELQIEGDPFAAAGPAEAATTLVDGALGRRPDLAVLSAEFEQAEQQLRLEVSRRWPGLALGTSISIDLPIFSRLNEPAIQVAVRRLEQVRDQVRAAVHEVRREIHVAVREWQRVRRQTEFFKTHTGPRLRRSLELTSEAFEAHEMNLLEALTAQRQVLDAEQRQFELRVALARAAAAITTATAAGLPIQETEQDLEDQP